jgi:hypothetical protein
MDYQDFKQSLSSMDLYYSNMLQSRPSNGAKILSETFRHGTKLALRNTIATMLRVEI